MLLSLTKDRAEQITRQMRDSHIVVLGDVMLDEFLWGDVTRISPEAPVPVVDIKRESTHLGGAANVLANLLALGTQACVIGVIGDDFAGERIRSSVNDKSAMQTDGLLIADNQRPTTIKTRIIAQHQMVVRADREHRTPVDAQTESRIIAAVKTALASAQALVISDYDKGVVTPHHHEALRLANLEEDSDADLQTAALMIRARLICDAVLITRGDRGMMLLEGERDPVRVETTAREVYDVTGAGDTVIATLAAALAA